MHPLTRYRKQSGTTQQALANHVGLSLSTIRKIETGVLQSLPTLIEDATPVTNADHLAWIANKRSVSAKALGLDPALSYSIEEILAKYPTVNAFCAAFCLRPKHLPKTKNSPVGRHLINALSEAGILVRGSYD